MNDPLQTVLNARSPGGGRHSALYLFFRDNYLTFKAEFQEPGPGPQWRTRVIGLAAIGLVGPDGNVLKIRTAQQTWYRVENDMAKRARRAKFRRNVNAVSHAKPGAVSVNFALVPDAVPVRVVSDVSMLREKRVNPSLKTQRPEARVQKESKQVAGEADAEIEGYDFKYARPGNYEDETP